MNLEFFIAKRLYKDKEGDARASRPAVRVAMISIALGLSVMILSAAIVVGFKKEVREIITGFNSQIQISNYDTNYSYETLPICASDSLLDILDTLAHVKHVHCFSTKPGIIKMENDFQGIVVKGVDLNYDWSFFSKNLEAGEVISFSDTITNDILISSLLTKKLNLHLGDSFITYFVQDDIRARKFKIKGIYNTNYSDFDKLFIVADMRHVQRLNHWESEQVSGIEIAVDEYENIESTWENVYTHVSNKADHTGNFYYPRTVQQMQPQVFDWLNLLDMNVWIIMFLLFVIAGFTMISGLLIIILERINMIGVLKALGASNNSIRKIFLHLSVFLIGKGLLIGNLIGLSLCYIQKYTSLIKLDPANYFLSSVPIEINYFHLILLNIGVLLATLLLMIAPSFLITKIEPSQSIRFD